MAVSIVTSPEGQVSPGESLYVQASGLGSSSRNSVILYVNRLLQVKSHILNLEKPL